MRRKNFGERLTREMLRVLLTLAFLVLVFWFCLLMLPDILTEMFRNPDTP